MINKVINIIIKYRIIILWSFILLVFGLTLLKFRAISNPTPDDDYLQSKEQSYQTDKIKIKDSVRKEIEKLEDTQINTDPGQVGTTDPFNP